MYEEREREKGIEKPDEEGTGKGKWKGTLCVVCVLCLRFDRPSTVNQLPSLTLIVKMEIWMISDFSAISLKSCSSVIPSELASLEVSWMNVCLGCFRLAIG